MSTASAKTLMQIAPNFIARAWPFFLCSKTILLAETEQLYENLSIAFQWFYFSSTILDSWLKVLVMTPTNSSSSPPNSAFNQSPSSAFSIILSFLKIWVNNFSPSLLSSGPYLPCLFDIKTSSWGVHIVHNTKGVVMLKYKCNHFTVFLKSYHLQDKNSYR